jgi:hypothetical protein
VERLKEVFSGESLSFEEFCERLNARPDIQREYVHAAELEKAKAKIDAEKAAREKDSADFAAELCSARKDMMIDLALSQAGAKNIKAAKALINEQAVAFNNGELCGIEQEIDRIGKDCPYLFGAAKGYNPPAPTNGAAAVSVDESEKWREEAGLPAK